jgi:glycosyltransferase 2 family protein
MNRFIRRLIVVLLFGVLLYGAFVVYSGYREVRTSLTDFHWSAFALALALATLNYVVRFFKWQYYLARLEIKGVAPHHSLLIFLSGFVLTITPGKVGEVFKSAVLSQTHGVPAARTAPIVIAERLTDAIGVIVLILIGSLGFSGGMVWAVSGTLAVVVGLVLILWRRPADVLLGILRKRGGRLTALAEKAEQAFDSLRVLASPVALLWPSLLSIVAWAFEGVALYVLVHGFGAGASFPLCLFFYSTATLAGALIPVPGGLVVVEAMLRQQLVSLGAVAPPVATASMILVRFATLWWAVLVGFVALLVLRALFPALRASGEPGRIEPSAGQERLS